MAEKIYLCIVATAYMLSASIIVINNEYSLEKVVSTLLMILMGYIVGYFVYKKMCKNTYEKNRLVLAIDKHKFNIFMFIYMIIMIIYALKTGDGKAESQNLFSSSIFASLWVPDGIFSFYYFKCREDYKKQTLVNTILYLAYKMLLGWTGVILIVFLYELSYRLRNKKYNLLKVAAISAASLIGGGVLYKYLYPLKYMIRYAGTGFNGVVKNLTMLEGIKNLASRLNKLRTTLFVNKNIDAIVDRYVSQRIDLLEVKSAFRPIIPSELFKNKVFSNIGSCIYNTESGYSGMNITDNCSILYYYRLLFKCDYLSFFISILLTVFIFWLFKYMTNMIQDKPGQFDFLFFIFIFTGWCVCGSLENLIMQTYIKFIFFIPLIMLTGVGKLRIRRR